LCLDITNYFNTESIMPTARVSATPSAIGLIHKLTAEHGPILFFQSGGCCEGSVPLCMPVHEFKPSPSDVVVGEIEGAVFYMGHNHFQFSENTHTIVDALPGSSGSFSLDCGSGLAFITRGRLYNDEELKDLAPVHTYGY
jgi:uncharacterized protein (DUF779 family)